MRKKDYFDIFAGIGLVDYALDENDWKLALAIDYDIKKRNIYVEHFNGQFNKYILKDVFNLLPQDLPKVYLGHASFPCTDVSSAGKRQGVQDGNQSSSIDSLLGTLYSKRLNERPEILLTENVKGLLTSHNGQDIKYLLQHYNNLGYNNDIVLIDAKYFVPQSRERIFIISTKPGIVPLSLQDKKVEESWMRPKAVMRVINDNKNINWTFLKTKDKPSIQVQLSDIVDTNDEDFWDAERTAYLHSQMSDKHKAWIDKNIDGENYKFATAFRRMREKDGIKRSTAEIRTDGIAGCLRTAKGGSAKQILIQVGRGELKARLLNKTECSRLMGAPNYTISKGISTNDYLYAFGDGVCSSVIKWLDNNYLTPIFNSNLLPIETHTPIDTAMTSVLSETEIKAVKDKFSKWCNSHLDHKLKLPIKGRLYGALVVLHNLKYSQENEAWGFLNTLEVTNTDKGKHFGDRSIKYHTSHRINLALSTLNRSDLIPKSGGEAGRTSTGTKRAGLGIIKIINRITGKHKDEDIRAFGEASVDLLNSLVIEQLDLHAELGGIEVHFSPNETIGTFLKKLIHFPSNNPGAILQHLVGAKLELRYKSNNKINIEHNKSATADVQTNRKGDFDLGNSVIHVTKSPTTDHFKKALQNAESGRITYLLIPEDRMGTADLAKDIDSNYRAKVNVYSVEQFISQNIDELSLFQKEISLSNLKELLDTYNNLIEQYENDSSLKIVIPDFGV